MAGKFQMYLSAKRKTCMAKMWLSKKILELALQKPSYIDPPLIYDINEKKAK